MSAASPIVLRVSRRYPRSAERVFDAWLDPERARRFLFTTLTGTMVRAEADARVGGIFVFTDRRDGHDVVHTGEYLEIARPRRLVFTFAVDDDPANGDRVTVEIVPLGQGCELTLTHEMQPEWAEYADRTREGWASILEGLAAAIA